MTPLAPLRWGILGTSRIAGKVIPSMQKSALASIDAIGSRDPGRARAMADQLGIRRAYGSYDEVIADPEIDAIYNPLPNHLHVPWSLRAAKAGKHVLCEKPLALSVEEVDAVRSAARRQGRVVMEAFMYRHHSQTLRVQELVKEGSLGTLKLIRGSFSVALSG